MFSFASGQHNTKFVSDRSVNHDIASLKQYVKSGEQALELKDWVGAFSSSFS
jgi:hypothetical protein